MEVTTVVLAQTKSQSLRTTVPVSMVRQFGLRDGSKLGWTLEVRDGRIVMLVAPVEAGVPMPESTDVRKTAPPRRSRGRRS